MLWPWTSFRSSTARSAAVSRSTSQKGSLLWQQKAPISFRKQLKEQKKEQGKTAGKNEGQSRLEAILERWELTVGIEIHAQLNSPKKLFSEARASNEVGVLPNRSVGLFDAAAPGTQPRLQVEAVIPALRAAIALNCDINRRCTFDRKHYFYPDQPAGYQITQYYEPIATNGHITLWSHDGIEARDLEGSDRVDIGISRIQIEQDTAQSVANSPENRLLDFNRVSHPLIEIISEPQIHSPALAAAYVKKVQETLDRLNVLGSGIELGGLRADVNVSVRPRRKSLQSSPLGGRVEIKNISSFKGVEQAVTAEMFRQVELLEGEREVRVIPSETRAWTLGSATTRRLRGKEGEVDYRYMPDPDIAPLVIDADLVDHLRRTNSAPQNSVVRELSKAGETGGALPLKDAITLVQLDGGDRLEYFYAVTEAVAGLVRRRRGGKARMHGQGEKGGAQGRRDPEMGRETANWVIQQIGAICKMHSLDWHFDLVPAHSLAVVLVQLHDNQLTHQSAREVVQAIALGNRRSPLEIIDEMGLRFRPMPEHEYTRLARLVVDKNPEVAAESVRVKGKFMWLVGQMMKMIEKGRADPSMARVALSRTLGPGIGVNRKN